MKKRAMMILAAAAGLGFGLMAPRATDAATTYSYVVGQGGSTIQSGSTVNNLTGTQTFNLYLQEVATSGSFTAASDAGLYSGAVAIAQTGGTGVTFTGVAANSGTEPTGFSGNIAGTSVVFTDGTGAYARDFTGNSASSGVSPVSTSTAGGTTTSLYLLGTVTMNIASDANATLKVTSLYGAPTNEGVPGAGSNDGNTLTYNNVYDLDGAHSAGSVLPPGASGADANPTTFAIDNATSVVPEPASLAVFGLGAAGLLVRRRRSA